MGERGVDRQLAAQDLHLCVRLAPQSQALDGRDIQRYVEDVVHADHDKARIDLAAMSSVQSTDVM